METLTTTDWQYLNGFLKSLYIPCSLETFPMELIAALPRVIGSELSGVVTFRMGAKTLPRFVTFPDPTVAVAAETYTALPQHFFSHPVARHYEKTTNEQALAISDLLTESEFHCQDLLYTGFFKHYGLEDQMVTYFKLPSTLQSLPKTDSFYRGQERCGLMVSRDRRNFTERDRLVLNLIRPHIKQACDTLVAFHQVHYQLAQQQAASDQSALIALSTSGTVQWMTQKAGEILHRYFPPSKALTAMPDLLQQWISRQLSMFSQVEEVCRVARPLRLQLEGRRLAIRFSFCPKAEQLYLLLEETEPEQLSVESLQLLGLTKRESEVLFWVAKDKSLVEVGKLLGMSDRTAKKHLEHIYEKFGVQTRLSAVMYALEHLGVFI